jgi:hypothetical protein
VRPGLNEIFCKRDYFINLHFLPTFLLIKLFSLFRLCIFNQCLSLFYNIFTVSVDQALPADENGSDVCVITLIGKK